MGFFFWFFCSILVVALVLLLFPFSVRIEFEAGERGARAFFYFFKKKVYEYEKKWGKGGDDKCVDRESRPSSLGHDRDQHLGQERSDCPKTKDERGAGLDERRKSKDEGGVSGKSDVILEGGERRPIESKRVSSAAVEVKDESGVGGEERKSPDVILSNAKDPVKSSSVIEVSSEAKTKKSENSDAEKSSDQASETKAKKPKPKLSDREFWTILLTPDLDARAFKYALKIIAAVFSLFRIRFSDCFVEGIRSDYVTMGYIAALNGILKAYPFVGDWDLRMDWLHEKELRATGNVRLSITLLRIFCFVLETLVLAGILAFIFWRRRAHVLKTKELPEIGFIRKKIVDLILED